MNHYSIWNMAGGWIAIAGTLSLIVLYSKVLVDILIEIVSKGQVNTKHGERYWVWLMIGLMITLSGITLVIFNQP